MHPFIPRSIMKHNMSIYEKRICFLKIILHQYINDPLLKKEKKVSLPISCNEKKGGGHPANGRK